MDPLGMFTAIDAVNRHVTSAQPGAPVVPDRPSRVDPLRKATADLLRRMAQRVEPHRPRAADPCRPVAL